MLLQIIVARYNEDISYLIPFANVIIVYNKGDDNIPKEFKNVVKLPNVGREGHTYLYHIINNYDNLADNTLFMQGSINDHGILDFKDYLQNKTFTGKLSKNDIKILYGHIKHRGKYLKDLKNGNLIRPKFSPFKFINDILGINILNLLSVDITWGAIFSVSSNIIRNKSIYFYKNIIKYVDYHNNPEEGHYLERSWYLLFNHPIIIFKNVILYTTLSLNSDLTKYDFTKYNDDDIKEIHIWTHLNDNIQNNNIKFIDNDKYVTIFPFILNNSFYIKFDNHLFLYLEFKNDIFEIEFNKKYINVFSYQSNKLIYNISINKNIFKNNFLIKWNNNNLFINDLITVPLQNNNTNINEININKIMVKGNNTHLDYSNKYFNDDNPVKTKIKMFIMNETKTYDKYYLNHYHNYYTCKM